MGYSRSAVLLVAAIGWLAASAMLAQTPSTQVAPPSPGPAADAILNRLPLEWRDRVKTIPAITDAQQKQMLAMSDDALRQAFARLLARRADADGFLRDRLRGDPSALVRRTLAQVIGADARWLALPDTVPLLESVVAGDPDAGVSLAALEAVRRWRMRGLNGLLTQRLASARGRGDGAAVKQLAEEADRWISLERGTMLPAFLREGPPVFAATPADRSVRVLAFGDFGNGSAAQKALATTIGDYHRRRPFDIGITLGDNFYGSGMVSPADPRWKTWWEDLYGPLGIVFYASLGNHDWGHVDSPAAEVLYSGKTDSWRMPATYYTFTAGPVQFFALDTNNVSSSDKQLAWLDAALAKSTARWKVVYGHHPVYSGGNYEDRPDLIVRLLPLLVNRADIYICGHDHNLQALRAEGGVRFFIAGGGGAGLYPLRPYERALFASSTNGFAVIDADAEQLTVSLVDGMGKPIYEDTRRR